MAEQNSNDAAINEAESNQRLDFDYIKSQFFRVIHADGAIGGLTPSGGVHFSFYSERPAIPRRQTFSLKSDGSLGQPIEASVRADFVRELDVDVIMSIEVARHLASWLSLQIQQWEEKIATQEKV